MASHSLTHFTPVATPVRAHEVPMTSQDLGLRSDPRAIGRTRDGRGASGHGSGGRPPVYKGVE